MSIFHGFLSLYTANKHKIILLITLIVLFLSPFVIWPQGNYVGGDDSRLYYLYPYEFLENFSKSYMSDNVISSVGFYFPQFYIIPFNTLLLILNFLLPFVSTQKLLYGANISLGFLSFYALQSLWTKSFDRRAFLIRYLCGLFYVFNPITMYSLWAQQLFSLYIIFLTPLTLWLFLKGVIEDKKHFVVLSVILCSLFSVVIVSAPWSLATLLVLLPFLFYFLKHNFKPFITSLLLFVMLFIGLNFYWLSHIGFSLVTNQQVDSNNALSALAQDFRDANAKGVASVISYLDVSYPLLSLSHHRLQKDFSWQTYPIFERYHSKVVLLNIIFPLIFVRAFYIIFKSRNEMPIFGCVLAAFLTSLYFFVVNILIFGPDLFIILLTNIPGFALFRNMYDKFAYPYVLAYSLLLSVSFTILNKKKDYYFNLLLFLFTLSIFLGALPLLNGDLFRLPIWKAHNYYPIINKLNKDYVDLTSKVKELDSTNRFIWYPLSSANYVSITDEYVGSNLYLGVSPLLILTGRNDFSGLLSFGQDASKLHKIVNDQDIDAYVLMLQKYGISHIIINHDIPDEILDGFAYGKDFLDQQQGQLLSEVLGNKIGDFGKRYSIYEVKESVVAPVIHLKNQHNRNINKDVIYNLEKVSSVEYKFSASDFDEEQVLSFAAPYHQLWRVIQEDTREVVASGHHLNSGNFGNEWLVNTFEFSRRESMDLRIEFLPSKIVTPSFVVSLIFIVLSMYLFAKFYYEK
jgi:hypothetical protein